MTLKCSTKQSDALLPAKLSAADSLKARPPQQLIDFRVLASKMLNVMFQTIIKVEQCLLLRATKKDQCLFNALIISCSHEHARGNSKSGLRKNHIIALL